MKSVQTMVTERAMAEPTKSFAEIVSDLVDELAPDAPPPPHTDPPMWAPTGLAAPPAPPAAEPPSAAPVDDYLGDFGPAASVAAPAAPEPPIFPHEAPTLSQPPRSRRASRRAQVPQGGLFSWRFIRKMLERTLTAAALAFFAIVTVDQTSTVPGLDVIEHGLKAAFGAGMGAAGTVLTTRFRGDPDSGSFTHSG